MVSLSFVQGSRTPPTDVPDWDAEDPSTFRRLEALSISTQDATFTANLAKMTQEAVCVAFSISLLHETLTIWEKRPGYPAIALNAIREAASPKWSRSHEEEIC